MNKIFAVIGSILCILIAAGLIKFLVSFDGVKSYYPRTIFKSTKNNTTITLNGDSNKIAYEYSFPASSVKDISVNLSAEGIRFEEGTDSSIKVYFMGDWSDTKHEAALNGTELDISSERKNISISFMDNRNVLVEIPSGKKDFDNIKVHISSGSIKSQSLSAKNMDLTSSSGSIKINDNSADRIYANSSSGSIRFEKCSFNNAEVKASSGSIHFDDNSINYLDAKSSSGSAHVSGSYDKLNVRSSSGSITVDVNKPLTEDSCFDCSSGSIHLTLPKESSYKLKYRCSSGSMKNEFTGTDGKSGSDVCGAGGPLIETYTTSGSIRINKN